MKKLTLLLFITFISIVLSSCSGKGCDLLILNWGDYMSDEVIDKFEKTYNVHVRQVTTDSNESMYSKVLNKQAEYDIVVPSDYMIDQMHEDNLLLEIDYDKLTNYEDGIFVSELDQLLNSADCKRYQGYYIPYFWGSLGIMYSTRKYKELEEIVEEYEWEVLFNKDILPEGCRVGMYNSSRDALAAAELYLGYSLNTKDEKEISDCMELLKKTDYYCWGSDDLKLDVASGKLDIALVYSGDFFDAYYSDIESGDEENTENYAIYAPKTHNNVFFDSLVIPNTSTNVDLAHKFIDFMLDFDNSYENASFIGYCPTLQSVYDEIFIDPEMEDVIAIDAYNPALIINEEDSLAEVYQYLGKDIYSFIEKKFTNVIFR